MMDPVKAKIILKDCIDMTAKVVRWQRARLAVTQMSIGDPDCRTNINELSEAEDALARWTPTEYPK